MKEPNLPGSPVTLRPHHAICALFFEGKGYSQPFIENMTAFLDEPGRLLLITDACDSLCQACPNTSRGRCADEGKVSLFDQRALTLSGGRFGIGETVAFNEICQIVYEDILQQGLLAEVCGACEWAALCQGKSRRGDFNRGLLQLEHPGSRTV